MKENLDKEYLTRVRKVLKSDLYSSNNIKAINTWAMPSLTYGYDVIKWSLTGLETIDTRTRKLQHVEHARAKASSSFKVRGTKVWNDLHGQATSKNNDKRLVLNCKMLFSSVQFL